MIRGKSLFAILFIIIILVGALLYVFSLSKPSKQFKAGTVFTVEEGESLSSLSSRLEYEGYIKSALGFRVLVSVLGRDKHIQLGGYTFDRPLPLYEVVKKMAYDNPDVPLVSITIPEGSTTFEIAEIIKKKLLNFSVDIFGEKVSEKKLDGKLFPSTYYLLPSTTEDRAIEIMNSTFEKKYSEMFATSTIPAPLKNRDDVINLAAILEGEAKTEVDMQIVAGILLQRLKKNMRLQVDVAMETYAKTGLSFVPINNPGLNSIQAVFNPEHTSYLYYLTGPDGTMYYSKTFAEHKNNIKKYLK
ncbi:MAG: hypothetical protein JWN37_753 [Candidatus Nomurabacteria bacterium]|nr:hypothetical protein [Candidatus Nomurabacteria bacterium]